jgi:hypothetical protein
MVKKWLIILLTIVIIFFMGLYCNNIEQRDQGSWTDSSKKLLEMKKYPRGSLKGDSLF